MTLQLFIIYKKKKSATVVFSYCKNQTDFKYIYILLNVLGNVNSNVN